MAFVLQFAPQEFVSIPKHGTIQYHPSLLPKYRGPSSINWPLIKGETKTGLTIFRPTDGLDEGPVILQKETDVSGNDTLGTVYFDRLFPMGVKAMLEAADLVVAGKHKEVVQDESQASYEGWFRANESKVNWNNHVDFIHDIIRGADPAPGAWTTIGGKKLQLFGSKKHLVRTFGAVKGKGGEISEIGAEYAAYDEGTLDDNDLIATSMPLRLARRSHQMITERDLRDRRRIDARHRTGRPDRGREGEARGRQEGFGGGVGEIRRRRGGNAPRLLNSG